jgi:hypothetical protein
MRGRRTGDECLLCEDGEYIELQYDRMCDTCWYAPGDDRHVVYGTDVWQSFWSHRDEYDAMIGDERKKAVGGFEGAYIRSEGLY